MSTPLTVDDVGVAAVTTADVSAEHARRVAAVLDAGDDFDEGSPLPLLWHWTLFAPSVRTDALGPDGHPLMSPGGPSSGLPRRMWAGGRIEAHEALIVGPSATRRSRILHAERKAGRSGDLLIVTISHQVEQRGRVVLTEEQDLVYRAPGTAVASPTGNHRPEEPADGWCEAVKMNPIILFRFSAITFNSHRIHYDLPYATAVEGYPGLVVHGPLTAMALAESARRRHRSGTHFDFRASAPLFADVPFTIVGAADSDATRLSAVRNDGAEAMTARLS